MLLMDCTLHGDGSTYLVRLPTPSQPGDRSISVQHTVKSIEFLLGFHIRIINTIVDAG